MKHAKPTHWTADETPGAVALCPDDWKSPQWDKKERVHNWRNYVPSYVRGMWDTFDPSQKMALSACFEEMANREEWD